MVGIVISGAVGALLAGWLATRIDKKELLSGYLLAWIVLLPLTAFQHNLTAFSLCMLVVGLLLGGTSAVARTVLISLVPQREITHAFSYYAISERLATFLGPLVWGLITYNLVDQGALRYRVALGAMAVFVIVGYGLLRTMITSTRKSSQLLS